MTTNLLVKYLSLLIGGMMVLVLASCKDDELSPDFDEPEVNITIPTESEDDRGKNLRRVGRALRRSDPLRDETYDRTTLQLQSRRHGTG